MVEEKKKPNKYGSVDESQVPTIAEQERARIEGSFVFWAPAEKFQIANYRREKRYADGSLDPEMPLRFEGHLCVCGPDEQDKVDFIKASNSFKAGVIRLCKDMAEANKFTRQHNSLKSGMRIMHVTDTSSVVVQDKPGTIGTTESYVEEPQAQATE